MSIFVVDENVKSFTYWVKYSKRGIFVWLISQAQLASRWVLYASLIRTILFFASPSSYQFGPVGERFFESECLPVCLSVFPLRIWPLINQATCRYRCSLNRCTTVATKTILFPVPFLSVWLSERISTRKNTRFVWFLQWFLQIYNVASTQRRMP